MRKNNNITQKTSCTGPIERHLSRPQKFRPNKSQGFSLMEMMLGMVILAAGIFGVFRLLDSANASAEIEQESKNLGSLAEGVRGAFLADGHFTGITSADVASLGIPGVKMDDANLMSNFGTPIVIRPATVRTANDAFDIVYHELDDAQCIKLIKSSYSQSYQILVNEVSDLSGAISTPGVDVQFTMGSEEGRIANDGVLTQDTRCRAPAFLDGQGIVAFRIYTYQSSDGLDPPPACICIPRGESQDLACPVGFSGTITQERTNDCSGGTAACPADAWTPWATTANTCTEDPSCTTPPCALPPPPPPLPTCNPYTQTQSLACPVGESGVLTQARNATCPDPYGPHVFTAWVTTQDTCVTDIDPPLTVCTPAVETRGAACPAGQGGSITERRQSTCPTPTGAPVWGAWMETSNTCSTSCVVTNNCCTVSTQEQTVPRNCGNGFYGSLTAEQDRSSTCSSATATPVWGAWYDTQVNGTCTACPAPAVQENFAWSPRNPGCPAGQMGTYTFEMQQRQTRNVSYSCPYGTPTLPAATIGSWSGYADTGVTRNVVNTCVPLPRRGYRIITNSVGEEVSCTGHDRYYRITSWGALYSNGSFVNGGTNCEYRNPFNPGDFSLTCQAPFINGGYSFPTGVWSDDELYPSSGLMPDPAPPAGAPAFSQGCWEGTGHSLQFCDAGDPGIEGADAWYCYVP